MDVACFVLKGRKTIALTIYEKFSGPGLEIPDMVFRYKLIFLEFTNKLLMSLKQVLNYFKTIFEESWHKVQAWIRSEII